MGRPRLLDLFCGAGGAAVGYARAGFDVTGVDIAPQKRYPFPFIQADALEYVAAHGHEYDAIHASPPCQKYSTLRTLPWLRDREYWDSIPPTRAALESTGRPWVIENVERAPLPGIVLCGAQFGLRVYRHRRFASNVLIFQPPHQKHREVIGHGRLLNDRARPNANGWVSATGKQRQAWRPVLSGRYDATWDGMVAVTGGLNVPVSTAGAAMGIDWMTGAELSQAIPPAYTEHVGRFVILACG